MIIVVNSFLLSLLSTISIPRRNPYISLSVRSFSLFASFRSMRTRERASERTRMRKFKKRKLQCQREYLFVCILFFCTYSTSIHISRQLYSSFLSVRLFFPIVDWPTFLFCSFSLVPFPFSLLPSHCYLHRESIKEFVCFPFVFGPNFSSSSSFFSLFFFYLSTLHSH